MSNENKQPDEREMNRYLVAQDDPNREAILNAHDVVVKNGGYSIGIVGAMLDAARATQQATKCGGRPAFDMLAHLQRQREFSERTFGPGPRTKGVCDHIRKELAEIESNPTDLTEWIDVVILALDGAWRAGAWPQQIIETLVAKQTKNEGRDWPDWRTADPDKAIEHDRSKDATTPSPVAGSAGQAPVGWKLVPLVPTDEMLDRGHHQIDFDRTDQNTLDLVHESHFGENGGGTSIERDMRDAWSAMLAAAPTAPSLTTDAGAVLTSDQRNAIDVALAWVPPSCSEVHEVLRAMLDHPEQRMSDAEDAARYRWLRRQAIAVKNYAGGNPNWEVDWALRGESFEAAIDAARKAESERSGESDA